MSILLTNTQCSLLRKISLDGISTLMKINDILLPVPFEMPRSGMYLNVGQRKEKVNVSFLGFVSEVTEQIKKKEIKCLHEILNSKTFSTELKFKRLH